MNDQFKDTGLAVPEEVAAQPQSIQTTAVVEALAQFGASAVTQPQEATERITLVAIHTVTNSTLHAETVINEILWQAIHDRPEVVAHWIAMDGRADITDEDSAVFVKKGLQKQAQDQLLRTGLASEGAASLGE